MPIITVGLNHKSAPVKVRELLSFQHGRATALLEALHAEQGGENLVLCTCNRTELYHVGSSDRTELIESLGKQAGLQRADIEDYFYCHHDREAVYHLLRVAAGLDSMVVGEYEILGQVREAFAAAEKSGSIGPVLARLFREALSAGKRVRHETEISQGVFSVGGCAVTLAKAIFGELCGAQVIIVGAGEMAEAVARALTCSGADSIFVANRTYEHARQMAEQLGGEAIHFDHLASAMRECHILISSTAAPHHVIEREMVVEVMRARRNRPLFLIDIAVPRDIAPEAGALDGVYLYNIDDLNSVVQQDSQARMKEADKAEAIIHQHAHQYLAWLSSRGAIPTLQALQERFEKIRIEELQEALRLLPNLSEADRSRVEQFSRALVKKILHLPMTQLRNGAGEQEDAAKILRRLFDLEEQEKQ